MKAYVKSILLSLFFTCLLPFNVAADEVTDVVNDVAAKLVQQLPMDKKIALKSLSPDETGLPESFLRQLVSETEAALMSKSAFGIKLLNRTSTEQIWEDAIEFGDADFDQLYAASKAEILLILDAQAAATGLTMNYTAYALDGDESGRVIASSGVVRVDIDLEKAIGINVKTINDDIAKIISKIQKISSAGGLISDPSDFSEYFHNARTYQERGQSELALANYHEALLLQDLFYDPLYEYLELTVAKYGLANAEEFLQNQLYNELTPQQKMFSKVYFSQEVANYFPRSGEEVYSERSQQYEFKLLADEPYFRDFSPPTYALFLRKFGDTLESVMQIENFGDFSAYPNDISEPAAVSARYLLVRAGNEVLNSYQTGNLGNFFIDDLKGSIFANVDKVKQYLESARIAMAFPQTIDHYYGTSGYLTDSQNMTLRFPQTFSLNDEDKWSLWSLPCGYSPDASVAEYPDVQVKTALTGFDTSITKPFSPHSTIVLPLYADKCVEQMQRFENFTIKTSNTWDAPIGTYNQQRRTIKLSAYNLAIFDDVDTTKPILLHVYYPPEGEGNPHYTVDIRSDGTQLTYGIEWWQTPEDRQYLKVGYPAVLTAQNIIQSSINYNIREHIPEFISYHNMRGEAQKVKIEFKGIRGNWLGREARPYADLNTSRISKFTKGSLNRFVNKPASCGVNDKKAKVIDVENFTNLRKEAGLKGPVIGQVPLGAQVSVINPGSFLRYDRCAATCNGTNQNAIKQCIDNNDVWIEVQYNGRKGFLSRKFLE